MNLYSFVCFASFTSQPMTGQLLEHTEALELF